MAAEGRPVGLRPRATILGGEFREAEEEFVLETFDLTQLPLLRTAFEMDGARVSRVHLVWSHL